MASKNTVLLRFVIFTIDCLFTELKRSTSLSAERIQFQLESHLRKGKLKNLATASSPVKDGVHASLHDLCCDHVSIYAYYSA